ncbi:hypothetical protein [Nostoc sp.]
MSTISKPPLGKRSNRACHQRVSLILASAFLNLTPMASCPPHNIG